MECLEGYTFLVMSAVILSGGVKMRVEHGMLREVYIFGLDTLARAPSISISESSRSLW